MPGKASAVTPGATSPSDSGRVAAPAVIASPATAAATAVRAWISSSLKSEDPSSLAPRSAIDDSPGSTEAKPSAPACSLFASSPLSPTGGVVGLSVGGGPTISPAAIASYLVFVALRISSQRLITYPPGHAV